MKKPKPPINLSDNILRFPERKPAMNEFTGESPIFRTGYNHDGDQVSLVTGLACDPDEGRTQQHHAEDADINTIVRRFGLTGELPPARTAPEFGDFTNATDFHTAMNAVKHAEQVFMGYPAELRARFNHDPGALLDFVHDAHNREEAHKLGLLKNTQAPVQSTTPQPDGATTEPKK